MSKKAKISIGIVIGVLVALIAAFAIYVSYYAVGKKALPGTTVGEVKVSGMTAAQIQRQLEKTQTSGKATFSGKGIQQVSFTPQEIGYQVSAASTAENATARSSVFDYVSSLFTSRKLPIAHTVDPAITNALSQEISKSIKDAKPATEPSVKVNKDGTGFETVAGKDGFGADTKALLTAAEKVMNTQKDQAIEISVGAVKPLADLETAQKLAELATKNLQTKVAIKAGDKEITADQKTKISFTQIPPVSKNAKLQANEKAVNEWVEANKKAVEVKKVDGKRFVNSGGKVLKTEVEAKDGVTVSNIDKAAQEISNKFPNGIDSSPSYETKVEKATTKDKTVADGAEKLAYMAAPGEKWIDVNLSNYTVTGYEGATVTKGPVSMVPGAPATPTIQGTFAIDRKYRSKTMRGFNIDGTPYTTPNVPYAMYFSGGYALHGAPWRGSFGWGGPGGSHGCVNMPVSAAGQFYNWAPLGTVVVSHR